MNRETNLDFFQEGLSSYTDALLAIHQFEKDVQKKSETVLKRNLPDLEQAFGTAVDAVNTELKCNKNRIVILTTLPRRIEAYFGLLWREGNNRVLPGVAVGFGFWTRAERDALKRAVEASGDTLICPDIYTGYLWEALTPENATLFEEKLETLLKKWITLWRGLGGLNGTLGTRKNE